MQSRKFLGGQGDRLSDFSGTYIPTGPITSLPPPIKARTSSHISMTSLHPIDPVDLLHDHQSWCTVDLSGVQRDAQSQSRHYILSLSPTTTSTRQPSNTCIPEITTEQHSAAHDASTAHAMAPTRSKRKVTFKRSDPLPTPKTKTGHFLLRNAAKNAASFAGKYLFGGNTIPSAVLPLPLPPLPALRDELYILGKLSVAPV